MSTGDPYEVLGVSRDASQKDIQAAYRRRAKKLHPDLNPGDKQAEHQFKELSAAYDILGDEDKRARFDRGEIDAQGMETPQRRYYRDFAGAEAGAYQHGSSFDDAGLDDILGGFFSRGSARNFRRRGADIRYVFEIDFLDAVNGASRKVTMPDGRTLEIRIPPGAHDGQILRLRGQGTAGDEGEPAGDALIELHVRSHPFFRRDGDDIRFDLPISLAEAVNGGKIRVPTPSGPVIASVPENSSSGRTLRLKGKGVAKKNGTRGDAFATLKIVLPDKPDSELREFVSNWSAGKAFDPRRSVEA
ncbi:DnaJ C-terminal domain-containing protein [Mesorhizobium sp. ANAO-SY3R2]|uniref:DnaJ C-terminal domain-containing protein n=1 Tax=Mesorhizobium sp. ANAO-SY3R2 TaxID=3166644 RepID=UPI00366AB337